MRVLILSLSLVLGLASNKAYTSELKALKDFTDEELRAWLIPETSSRSSGTRGLGARNVAVKPKSIQFSIQFEFDSYEVSQEDVLQLERLAIIIKSSGEEKNKFLVEGHTDKKGTYSYNMNLSERRAASVMKILVDYGVADRRMTAIGKGFTELLNESDPFSGENRRVKIFAMPN